MSELRERLRRDRVVGRAPQALAGQREVLYNNRAAAYEKARHEREKRETAARARARARAFRRRRARKKDPEARARAVCLRSVTLKSVFARASSQLRAGRDGRAARRD